MMRGTAVAIGWGGQVGKGGGKKKTLGRAVDDRVRTTRQPHRRALPSAVRSDERAESPLGRLVLRGVIDEDQYDAGGLFAAKVASYRATIETPAPIAGTLGDRAVSDYPADAETVDAELADGCIAEQSGEKTFCFNNPGECSCLARRQTYMAAYEALHEAVGRRGVMVISRVAVHREEIAREDLVYLKRGLTALAEHFGLLGSRKRAD